MPIQINSLLQVAPGCPIQTKFSIKVACGCLIRIKFTRSYSITPEQLFELQSSHSNASLSQAHYKSSNRQTLQGATGKSAITTTISQISTTKSQHNSSQKRQNHSHTRVCVYIHTQTKANNMKDDETQRQSSFFQRFRLGRQSEIATFLGIAISRMVGVIASLDNLSPKLCNSFLLHQRNGVMKLLQLTLQLCSLAPHFLCNKITKLMMLLHLLILLKQLPI